MIVRTVRCCAPLDAQPESATGRMTGDTSLTRRDFLGRGAKAAGVLALGAASGGALRAAGALAERREVPLPSPRHVRADFQRMVDFGPRLTGTSAHGDFVDWLADEFVWAGCQLRPCDVYHTSRWSAKSFDLQVLTVPAADP